MNSAPRTHVFFTIIAYGQPELVARCVNSLRSAFPKQSITVIDNASPISLRPVVAKLGVQYVRLPTNVGYAGACNHAVKLFLDSSMATLCVMNSDVFVDATFASELTKRLAQYASDRAIALFQPTLYFTPTRQAIENCGIAYYKSGLAFQAKQHRGSNLCNGACLFLQRGAIEQLLATDGYVFEQAFWSYAEDVELSLRLRSRGWKTEIVPSLQAVHLQSASFGRRSVKSLSLYARNLLWILVLTRTRRELLLHFPLILLGQLRIASELLVRGRPDVYISILVLTVRKRAYLRAQRVHWRSRQMIDINEVYRHGAFPLPW